MTKIETAMILAAGRGTRMRARYDAPPKPLTLLGGQTLLDRMIEKLLMCHVRRLIINVHFKADWIEAHLKQQDFADMEVIISDEREALLKTGGGVLNAKSLIGAHPFFVCNADVFWSEDTHNLQALAQAFKAQKMSACLLLAQRKKALGYEGAGDFFMSDEGMLRRRGQKTTAPLIYAGAQIVHPDLLNEGPVQEPAFSFNVFWDAAISKARLHGVQLHGDWMHIGTPEGLRVAEKYLLEK